MAKKTMNAIREAEAAADQAVRDARKEADRIVDEAMKEAAAKKEQAKKDATAAVAAVRSQAADIGDQETAQTLSEGENDAEALKILAERKKDEAVQMVKDLII